MTFWEFASKILSMPGAGGHLLILYLMTLGFGVYLGWSGRYIFTTRAIVKLAITQEQLDTSLLKFRQSLASEKEGEGFVLEKSCLIRHAQNQEREKITAENIARVETSLRERIDHVEQSLCGRMDRIQKAVDNLVTHDLRKAEQA